MRRLLKSLLIKLGRGLFSPDLFSHYHVELLKEQTGAKATQILFRQHYRALARQPDSVLPSLRDVGFRQYSQFEGDGILLYLFSLIPPESRTCVEICAGDGIECNTANFIINDGGGSICLMDAPKTSEKARRFTPNTVIPAPTHPRSTADG